MKLKNIALTITLSIIFSNISANPANVVCIKPGTMGAMNKNVPSFMGEFTNKQNEKCYVFTLTSPISPSTPTIANRLHTDTDLEAF